MIRTFGISDIGDLIGYRLLRNALLLETPAATLLHSLDWLVGHVRHFGRDQRLRVLLVYSDSQPIGIPPLPLHVLLSSGCQSSVIAF